MPNADASRCPCYRFGGNNNPSCGVKGVPCSCCQCEEDHEEKCTHPWHDLPGSPAPEVCTQHGPGHREAFEEAASICERRADGRGIAAHEKRHLTAKRRVTVGSRRAKSAELALRQAAQEIRARAEGGTKEET